MTITVTPLIKVEYTFIESYRQYTTLKIFHSKLQKNVAIYGLINDFDSKVLRPYFVISYGENNKNVSTLQRERERERESK